MQLLQQPVGRAAPNQLGDVRLVQLLLNQALAKRSMPPIVADGKVGARTIEAIEAFQASNQIARDGVVAPNGPTIRKLLSAQLADLEAGLDPSFRAMLESLPGAKASASLSPLLTQAVTAMRRVT